MTAVQVLHARRIATTALAGIVALSLMAPSHAAFADYWIGDDAQARSGDVDSSGNGSESGSWSYSASNQQLTLVDYVGGRIAAANQDLTIVLDGDSTVNGNIGVTEGDLVITGTDGEERASLTMGTYEQGPYEGGANEPVVGTIGTNNGDITLRNVNVAFAEGDGNGSVKALGDGDVLVDNSSISDQADDNYITLSAGLNYNQVTGSGSVILRNSDVEAFEVKAAGSVVIENANLTVVEPEDHKRTIASAVEDHLFAYEYQWLRNAITAFGGIELRGEANGTVAQGANVRGETVYYLSTGADDKVGLKALRYSAQANDAVAYTPGESAGLVFTFKRNVSDSETFSHFMGVLLDGVEIDSSNYTAAPGSVIVTLKPAFAESLAEGDHVLTAQFDDGADVSVDFKVLAQESASDAEAVVVRPAPTQGADGGSATTVRSAAMPATGDAGKPFYVGLSAIAIIAAGAGAFSMRQLKIKGKHVAR